MKILLLGYRKVLYENLLDYSQSVFVIDEKFPFKKNPSNFYNVNLKDYHELKEIALTIKPDFIIAATEKAVLSAAKLRKDLGVWGETYDTASLCTNKLKMKIRANELQIPITEYRYVENGYLKLEDIKHYNTPVVIKSIDESGGRNTSYYEDKSKLTSILLENQLVESFIDGFECSVEILVKGGSIIFTNITTYAKKYTQNILPANLPIKTQESILTKVQSIITGFGIKNSLCHVEFYINNNDVIFGEIAIRPPGGYIMSLLELSYGENFWKYFIETQLNLKSSLTKNLQAKQYSAVWIIHPGFGLIKSISGWNKIQDLTGYSSGKLKLKAGDATKERLGSGQDYGYVFFTAKSPEELIKTLDSAEELLKVDITNASITANSN